MAKKVIGVSFMAIALIAIVIICILALTPQQSSQASQTSQTNIVSQAKNAVVNEAIDASGVKGAVSDALMSHAGDIANATGISNTQVKNVIEGLDIDDWQATTLPADAEQATVISGSAAGVPATLTTYTDPSYVSVTAYGQTIDLAVPQSAQQYLPLLSKAA